MILYTPSIRNVSWSLCSGCIVVHGVTLIRSTKQMEKKKHPWISLQIPLYLLLFSLPNEMENGEDTKSL